MSLLHKNAHTNSSAFSLKCNFYSYNSIIKNRNFYSFLKLKSKVFGSITFSEFAQTTRIVTDSEFSEYELKTKENIKNAVIYRNNKYQWQLALLMSQIKIDMKNGKSFKIDVADKSQFQYNFIIRDIDQGISYEINILGKTYFADGSISQAHLQEYLSKWPKKFIELFVKNWYVKSNMFDVNYKNFDLYINTIIEFFDTINSQSQIVTKNLKSEKIIPIDEN